LIFYHADRIGVFAVCANNNAFRRIFGVDLGRPMTRRWKQLIRGDRAFGATVQRPAGGPRHLSICRHTWWNDIRSSSLRQMW